jgi:hypothetical protein
MATEKLRITHTDMSDGEVLLGLQDDASKSYEVRLGTASALELIAALNASLREAADSPLARSEVLPDIQRVQLVETETEVFFRVFLKNDLCHEYPVPINTSLADDLRFLSDRVAARQEARVTNRPPDSPSGKN